MKKILYATDFSERSRKSFSYALQTARMFKAELVLVHVYQIPDTYKFPYTPETLEFENNEIAEYKNKLQEIFDLHYGRETPDVKMRYMVVRDSSVFRGISKAIHDELPSVLMLGAKGDNMSQEDLFGGVVNELIRDVIVPVITIPENIVAPKFEKILFATNLYESEITAIKQLVEKVGSLDPEITIAHVRTHKESEDDVEKYWDRVRKQVDYPKLKFQELLSDDIFGRLNDYIHNNDFDLLTMTNKEHVGVFYRLLHADLLKKIETHSTIPVLSFNDEILEIFKDRNENIQAFKDSISAEMVQIKRKEENRILSSISRITKDIETNYPELYNTLEEEPITLPTDNHPNVDIEAMTVYLDSLQEKLSQYREHIAKGKSTTF